MNISPQPNRRILVIDDNKAIHDDFKKILKREQNDSAEIAEVEALLFTGETPTVPFRVFEIDSAFQGREGLEMVKKSLQESRPYALVFMDVRMPPGWDGIETTVKLWEVDPNLEIVICTAYSDYSWDEMMARLGVSDRLVILKKPFDNVEIIQLAHALAEKWDLRQKARTKMEEMESIVAARTQELQSANRQLKIEMEERARTEETLRQAQKMEALGQLAGGVAHDFNNLLTVIQGYTECLLADNPTPESTKALREIGNAANRAAKLTSQMLTFSRKRPFQKQNLNLNDLIGHLAEMLRRLLGENINTEIQYSAQPLTVHADPVMMEQVILNLSVNARDAMPDGGKLTIRTDETGIIQQSNGSPGKNSGRFACVHVSDTGCGIAPNVLPHLFEPFFTTKGPGKGTGMGLATVYGIIEQHDGWIEVNSALGKGTDFRVFLPLKAPEANAVNGSRSHARVSRGTETILLVEDEDVVRRLGVEILQRYGYQVYEAASGAEALSVWKERSPEIDLLLTDMILPGKISGSELAQRLQSEKNRLKIAYITGYGMDAVKSDCALMEGVNFLPKPYTLDELAHMVRSCLDEPVKTETRVQPV